MKVGPRATFVDEIKENLQTTNYECLFYKTSCEKLDLEIKSTEKLKFEAKLTLRDTLKGIYDQSVRVNSNEISL